jgi:ABC-2 type transport system ATP-binding protein
VRRAWFALAPFLLLASAPAAQARDATVTSFDGTQIQLSFMPADGAGRHPTVLEGHGWGGSRDTNPDSASDETTGNVGVGALRRAGLNVLTWDARGFGNSGGTVEVDSPEFEGRDVSALIDWLAKQPEARLDKAGDPRVGMTGVSYAGGIELVSAPQDARIDAIAPIIAWHSLTSSLYKAETVKGGWASLLYAAGVPGSKNRLDPHITSAFTSGLATGTLSAEDRAWFASRGPGDAVNRIRVPTLLVEGTADTLFTLHEAITNYAILRANRVPVKMVWFCGGHGVCLTGSGPAGHVEGAVVAWLRRYLAGDASVDTGPRFEWLADDAKWRAGDDYPLPAGAPVTASGSGTLVLNPADAVSGTPLTAGRAANAVNVAVDGSGRQIVGEPALTLTYSGTGVGTHVFAQLVDDARGVVAGNQATPIPVILDGQPHTITRPLEAIASAGGRYTLQVMGGTMLYGPVRGVAAITFSRIGLSLPTAGAEPPLLAPRRTCISHRRFQIRMPKAVRTARVTLNGKRVKTFRRAGRVRAVIDLRGRARSTVKVRAVARTKGGRTLHQTRTYHVCG